MPQTTRRHFLTSSATLAVEYAACSSGIVHTTRMFPDFDHTTIHTAGTTINALKGGKGTPVLLLHGYPQTHVMWHKVAPLLAQDFSVVLTDLRGYGDSGKPVSGPDHAAYSKRLMAQDQVEVMHGLGFQRFAVVGHDRGGRVAHRMALDHPDSVTKLAVLDIVPTYKLYSTVSKQFATDYFHWFFLIQDAPLPEVLLGDHAEFWLKMLIGEPDPAGVTPEAFAEYLRCFSNPSTVHATCEDYRAAASIDLIHDEADLGKKVGCPVLALWGKRGAMHRLYDVAETWRERASDVKGKALPSGHFLAERVPQETVAELKPFLYS